MSWRIKKKQWHSVLRSAEIDFAGSHEAEQEEEEKSNSNIYFVYILF